MTKRLLSLGLVLTLLQAGCSTTKYRDSADKEVYRIIKEKSAAVPGMVEDFDAGSEEGQRAEQNAEALAGLPAAAEAPSFLGPQGGDEQGASVVSLEQALRLAVQNSRTYQSQEETLYLAALGLTLDRHQYTPIFGGSVGGSYNRTTTDVITPSSFPGALSAAGGIITEVETLTGQPGDLMRQFANLVGDAGGLAGLDEPQTEIANERSLSGDTNLNVRLLLKGGGHIALGLTSNFLRFLTGDPRTATASTLGASLTQPLLQGAGSKIAAEHLTQAERDVLYALRGFTRFRKTFVIDVCSAYYSVLQSRDIVHNNFRSYENFQRNVERERAFTAESRRTQAELGRLEQAFLNAENTWTNAIRRYREALDQFKIRIGLSTDANIVLDDSELEQLRLDGLNHPELASEDAVAVALASRLNLYTEYDRVEDAARKVDVAANALLPGLNILAEAQVASSGEDRFQELDFRRARWSAGLGLDLPLDRKTERNAYRAALINYERALRNATLEKDNVKLEVRAAWRNLDQARRNFDIARQSVDLNVRRVLEQELLAELGRATVLNQVDAQNDLTQSQNDLTGALVNHTLARLAFWRDIGILYVKKDGRWEEVNAVAAPAALEGADAAGAEGDAAGHSS